MNTMRRQLVVAALLVMTTGLTTGITLAAEPVAEPTPAEVRYFRAVQLDNVAGVKKALADGVRPNARDAGGETGLIVAIRHDANKVATALLETPGIDLEAKAPNGNTALMMAAFRKNMPLVVDMLRRGARVNQQGWSALHYAAAGGSVEITNLLLDHQARIDAEAPAGLTPLMLAAREGQEDVVKVLLARGADATLKDGGFHLTASGFALKADKPWIAKAIDAHLASQVKPQR
ncbi:MAG: ankyrin repeat domain-containing protein [Duganella sp.]